MKTTPRGKPEKDKILALILFLSGLSMSATDKIVGITAQSVMRWIRKMHAQFIPGEPDISTVTEVEMDGMYHFIEAPHTYSDRYESYKEFIPQNHLTQSKKYTSAIERNNGWQNQKMLYCDYRQKYAMMGAKKLIS